MWVEPRSAPRPTGRGAYRLREVGMMEAGRREVGEDSPAGGPGMRLMRLWLWTAPLAMLALAALFGWLAVDEGKWGLLVAMVLLALVAGGLFVVQWRVRGGGLGRGG